jgi:hypothetical protein
LKKLESHAATVAIYFMQTLRLTPATEAGIADHVWSIEEIVGLLNGRLENASLAIRPNRNARNHDSGRHIPNRFRAESLESSSTRSTQAIFELTHYRAVEILLTAGAFPVEQSTTDFFFGDLNA